MDDLTKLQRHELDELDHGFRETLAAPGGRRVLFWMLEQCAIYQDAFAGDNNVTNYTLGLQAGGRKLIAKLDAIDPLLYPNLLLQIADLRAMDRAATQAEDTEQGNDDAED
jgi:hypothetical protein